MGHQEVDCWLLFCCSVFSLEVCRLFVFSLHPHSLSFILWSHTQVYCYFFVADYGFHHGAVASCCSSCVHSSQQSQQPAVAAASGRSSHSTGKCITKIGEKFSNISSFASLFWNYNTIDGWIALAVALLRHCIIPALWVVWCCLFLSFPILMLFSLVLFLHQADCYILHLSCW